MATTAQQQPPEAEIIEVVQADGAVLRYCDETHTYSVREKSETAFRRVLSVTQILAAEGVVDFSMVKQEIMEYKRSVGSAAHAATDLIDKNCLDWDTLAPEIEGYVNAYISFLDETGFTVRLSEARRLAKINGLRFGMTVDREGTFTVNGKTFPAIVDLKTSATVPDYTAIQCAFYDVGLGYPPEGKMQRERFACQLKPDGTYKAIAYTDKSDYGAAAGMIASVSWKLLHKYITL